VNDSENKEGQKSDNVCIVAYAFYIMVFTIWTFWQATKKRKQDLRKKTDKVCISYVFKIIYAFFRRLQRKANEAKQRKWVNQHITYLIATKIFQDNDDDDVFILKVGKAPLQEIPMIENVIYALPCWRVLYLNSYRWDLMTKNCVKWVVTFSLFALSSNNCHLICSGVPQSSKA